MLFNITSSIYVYRFKTPKDAEAWYNGQAVNVTANAPSLSTVCHGLNTTATQTSPVESCLVEYALNQLPAESRLLALSKLFSAYLSDQLSLIVPNDFFEQCCQCNVEVIRWWSHKCTVQSCQRYWHNAA